MPDRNPAPRRTGPPPGPGLSTRTKVIIAIAAVGVLGPVVAAVVIGGRASPEPGRAEPGPGESGARGEGPASSAAGGRSPLLDAEGRVAVPDGFALMLTYHVVDGGGTRRAIGFPVSVGAGLDPVLLTPHHWFGREAGHDRQWASEEIGERVSHLILEDAIAVGRAERAIVLPGASPWNREPGAGDAAAFWIEPGHEVRPAPLALRPPEVGERVFMLPSSEHRTWHGAAEARPLEAEVVGYDDAGLMRFRLSGRLAARSSGCAVVNADGEVVGIALGPAPQGVREDGDVDYDAPRDPGLAVANPTATFGPALLRAVSKALDAEADRLEGD